MTDIRTSVLGGIPYGDNAGRPSSPEIGQLYSNGEASRLELYTVNGWQNISPETPSISEIIGHYYQSDSSGTFTLSGNNFTAGALAYAIGTNGVEYDASESTFISIAEMSVVFNNLSAAYEPYDIKVVNPSNLFGILPGVLYVNESPIWSTSAGSLGNVYSTKTFSTTLSATDAESNSITYSSSNLPSWLSLNTSTGVLSGTAPTINSLTTYSFSVTASDGYNTPVSRSFSISGKPFDGSASDLPVVSATSLYSVYPSSTTGDYWVKGSGSTAYKVYCLMDQKGGKWMRVANFNRGYDTGNNNFYTYAVSSGPDFGLATTSNFNIPSNLFGTGNGANLDVMIRIVGGVGASSTPGTQFGSIWRGVNANDWMNAGSTSSIGTSSPAYSVDGTTFTSYSGATLIHSNDQWNITISTGDGAVLGGYNYANLNGAGFILHASGNASNLGILYGYLDGVGSISGESNWTRAEIYVRVI